MTDNATRDSQWRPADRVDESSRGDSLPWREATEAEIRAYYQEEFPQYCQLLPWWVTPDGPEEFAAKLSTKWPNTAASGYEKEFIRRSTRMGDPPRPVFIDHDSSTDRWTRLVRLFGNPARNDPLREFGSRLEDQVYALEAHVPDESAPTCEAVYYSLAHHDEFWLLAFDIDSKDIADDDGREGEPPVGYPYGFDDIQTSLTLAFDLGEWVESTMGLDGWQVFYSGQGAHLVVPVDADHRFTKMSRETIGKYARDRLGVPIDLPVTVDRSRVLRLPYSLHAEVSRIVVPVDDPEFDPRQQAVPSFLL